MDILSLLFFILATIIATQSISHKAHKKTVIGWTAIGIAASLLKVSLIQITPQWLDIPPDALKYKSHATAFFLHWSGLPVSAEPYNLAGLLNNLTMANASNWMPHSETPYASVLGSNEWVYAAFAGLWRFTGDDWLHTAILANAILAGALPATAFMICNELNAPSRVKHFAALIVTLDPMTALNSSWLLKDSMAAFLTAFAIISICRLYRGSSWRCATILGISVGLLAGIRFVGFIAFGLVILCLFTHLTYKKLNGRAMKFCASGLMALFLLGVIYTAPHSKALDQTLAILIAPLTGQATTFTAQRHQQGADEAVIQWRDYVNQHPLLAPVRAVARTLLAPYPWTALTEGISGKSHLELYQLATIFWILILPGIATGMFISPRRSIAALPLLLLLLTIATPYLIFFGEWSTRQRIFMSPLFYSFAAIGLHYLATFRSRSSPLLQPPM